MKDMELVNTPKCNALVKLGLLKEIEKI